MPPGFTPGGFLFAWIWWIPSVWKCLEILELKHGDSLQTSFIASVGAITWNITDGAILRKSSEGGSDQSILADRA
jgi:hypothetical protein